MSDNEIEPTVEHSPRVTTWANGFGVWHVRGPRLDGGNVLWARKALRDELLAREAHVAREVWVHPVEVPELGDAETMVYRENTADLGGEIGVYYTGDVVTPNGSDICIYDDGCLEGHGADLTTGWIDPDWCLYQTHENREDVRPDRYDPEDTDRDGDPLDPVRWLVQTVTDRLGWIETELGGAGDTVLYASETDNSDHVGGKTVSLAAHPYGFTAEQLEAAMVKFRAIRAHELNPNDI